MIRHKIQRRDTPRLCIFDNHVQQFSCDTLTAVRFFCIDRAHVWRQVFPVVEIIFDYTHATDNAVAIKTKIPTIFRRTAKICLHTFQICRNWNPPFVVKPRCSRILQIRPLPQGHIPISFHDHFFPFLQKSLPTASLTTRPFSLSSNVY